MTGKRLRDRLVTLFALPAILLGLTAPAPVANAVTPPATAVSGLCPKPSVKVVDPFTDRTLRVTTVPRYNAQGNLDAFVVYGAGFGWPLTKTVVEINSAGVETTFALTKDSPRRTVAVKPALPLEIGGELFIMDVKWERWAWFKDIERHTTCWIIL